MHPTRTSARFMETGFCSKFTNTPNHPVVLDDDDDFVTPPVVARQQLIVIPSSSNQNLGTSKVKDKHEVSPIKQRFSPRSSKKKSQVHNIINQLKKPTKNIRKKLKAAEASQVEVGNPNNSKKKTKNYKNVKHRMIKRPTPRRFPPFHHRMSPTSVLQAMRCLSKDQKKLINEMGFGALLQLKIDTLPGKLGEFVVRNYCTTTSSIHNRSGQVMINKQKIHDMLGLPFHGININSLPEVPESDPLLVAWKNQFQELNYNTSNYLDLIRASDTADDIFRLNFLVLFINTFCESMPTGTSNIRLIPKLARVRNVASIDWCQYLIECLETSRYKWRPNDLNLYYIGPLTLLLLIYVDGVRCPGVRIRRKRPFISAVDTEALRRIEKYEISHGEFGQGEVLADDEGVGMDDDSESEMDELPFVWASSTVDDFNRKMNKEYKFLIGKRQMIEDAIQTGCALHPDNDSFNDSLRSWSDKMHAVFFGFQGHKGGIGADQLAIAQITNASPPVTPPHVAPDATISLGMNLDDWIPSPRTCDEIDRIVLNTLEKKRLKKSVPSFDLRLSLTIDDYKPSIVHGETSKQMTDTPSNNVKISTFPCSPYVSKVVSFDKKVTVDEQIIGQTVFASHAEDGIPVWEMDHDHTMFLGYARTLAPSCKVAAHVIDCWAAFLNKEEEQRALSSPPRIFFGIYVLNNQIIDEKANEVSRYEQFKENLKLVLDKLPEERSIIKAELVFFPMVHDDHYYLIQFNFKDRLYINLIDSTKPYTTVEARYGNRPRVLQTLFCKYLKEIGHPKYAQMFVKKITIFKMKWQTTNDQVDGGIYLMRHMECHMGQLQTKWLTGFEADSKVAKKQVLRLRYKYITKFLLSDLNKQKQWILSEAEEFRKLDSETRKKRVIDTMKLFGYVENDV